MAICPLVLLIHPVSSITLLLPVSYVFQPEWTASPSQNRTDCESMKREKNITQESGYKVDIRFRRDTVVVTVAVILIFVSASSIQIETSYFTHTTRICDCISEGKERKLCNCLCLHSTILNIANCFMTS